MVARFIAALICLCAVNAYLVPHFLKGNFGKAAECGRRQPMTVDEFDKIVGGQIADHGEYPWQVSLQSSSWSGGYSHFCGGSILDAKTIITAAHCIDGESASSLQVVAGEYRLNQDDGTEQTVKVSKIVKHRSYTGAYKNDIALLKLATAIDLSGKYASPVCLPSTQGQEHTGYSIVTGWGSTRFGGSGSSILMEVSVPLITDAKCRQFYSTSQIADSMVCAGYDEGGKDSCQGDSGGPLVVEKDDGSAELVGIVSWGDGCAAPKRPGVYTQVSHFVDWISANRV